MNADNQILFQEMEARVNEKSSDLTNSHLKGAIEIHLETCKKTINMLELPVIPNYLSNTTAGKEIEKTENRIYSIINNFS